MTRRDFVKGAVAGAVIAAIAVIGIEELRMAGIEAETTTTTSTATETQTQTSTSTQTSTVTSTVPTTTTETSTVTTQVGTVTETETSTVTSPVTTTATTTVPTTTTQTVTSTTTVGEVPVVGLSREIVLNVNGEDYEVEVENRTTLLEVLNNKLFMTGAKDGCSQGECGSCTVLVDGIPTLGCMSLAVALEGAKIETIEGLAPSPASLHPIQQAFLENDGLQCGWCTPGIILATKALFEMIPSPTVDDVKYYLGGNLCKCGSYPHILNSVLAAAGG
jgi:aerobic-type carbon monoxide dehydrogenase small subunit (CoxS/CutS family)